jgi:hypothetical protein
MEGLGRQGPFLAVNSLPPVGWTLRTKRLFQDRCYLFIYSFIFVGLGFELRAFTLSHSIFFVMGFSR